LKFSDFNLNAELLRSINAAGFTECLPVQAETYKNISKSSDIIAESQTGTGKTIAFLVYIFQLLLENEIFKGTKCLIIAPTRELVVQIENEAKLIADKLNFRIGSFFGGANYSKQEKQLKEGTDIIIGTPGRLLDFKKSKLINPEDIGILVIDEADRLFDMGFYPDIKRLLKGIRHFSKRKTLLYSATINSRVRNLSWEYMENPVEIKLTPEQVTVENISQKLFHVSIGEKMGLLLGILKKENPGSALVFTNTRNQAFDIAKRLEYNGIKCEYLIGDLSQQKRLRIINDFKNGDINILIATDVAARGLHINDLELVINYDLPMDCENYLHRIGRTARAGKKGRAISFSCEKFVYSLEAIESMIKMKIPVEWAENDIFVVDKSKGMRFYPDKWGKSKRDSRNMNHPRRDRKPERKEKHFTPGRKISSKPDSYRKNTCSSSKQRDVRKKINRGNKDHREKPLYNRNQINTARPKKKETLNDRLEYYKKKYGEDFKVTEKTPEKEKRKKNIFLKIGKLFKNKK